MITKNNKIDPSLCPKYATKFTREKNVCLAEVSYKI